MSAGNRTSSRKARLLDTQLKVMELRRMGKGYVEIANQLGISKSAAHRMVVAALQETRQLVENETAQLKAEEVSRLDAMLAGLWADARKGSFGAIDRVLRIMERRAKLLGLDAPTKHANTDPSGEFERQPAVWALPPEMSLEEWQKAASAAVSRP